MIGLVIPQGHEDPLIASDNTFHLHSGAELLQSSVETYFSDGPKFKVFELAVK